MPWRSVEQLFKVKVEGHTRHIQVQVAYLSTSSVEGSIASWTATQRPSSENGIEGGVVGSAAPIG